MKILLLEPPTGEKGITTFMYPPMGLIALAAYVRQYGHGINIYDANINHANLEGILDYLRSYNPDIVGISTMSLTINYAFEIAECIKNFNSKIWVILGGVHPTVCPEHVLSNKNIDAIIMGEGEMAFIDLINAIANSKNFDGIESVGFKKNGQIVLNSRRCLIENLDSLPIPAYDLLDIKKYHSPYTSRMPFISMVRSRGCVFRCTFCGNPKTFGQTFRCQSPERTIKEMDYLIEKFGIREISFKDTELTLDKNLERLCDLLIEKKYDLIWSCNGRVSNVNENLLKKMYMAGCRSVTYGIESGDEAVLKNLKKPIKLRDAIRAVKITKHSGFNVVTNFMIGNPGDTKETIEKTINFAIELDPDYAYFGFTTPFPGTELREQAQRNNWILNKSFDAVRYDYPIMNATNLEIEELSKYLDRAYRSFYFRPKFILRQLRGLNIVKLKTSVLGVIAIILNMLKVRKVKLK